MVGESVTFSLASSMTALMLYYTATPLMKQKMEKQSTYSPQLRSKKIINIFLRIATERDPNQYSGFHDDDGASQLSRFDNDNSGYI